MIYLTTRSHFCLLEWKIYSYRFFLPHSKPLVVGTVYRPRSQGSFTETITEYFSKINPNDTEILILGDFNINLFSKQKYIYSIKRILNQYHLKLKLFPILFLAWLRTTNKVSNSSNM